MRKASKIKFDNYILNPDIANKFLIPHVLQIPTLKTKNIYLMYVFRQKSPYSFMAIKATMMLSSVTTKNCKTKTKVIKLRYTKKQSHSLVFLILNFNEFMNAMQFFYKKPAALKKYLTSYVNEKKHFIFPGYIRHLRMPSWKANVNISFRCHPSQQYWLYFFKTIYFD